MKSGNINFLEPSGPLQACNGTALTFLHILEQFPEKQWKTFSLISPFRAVQNIAIMHFRIAETRSAVDPKQSLSSFIAWHYRLNVLFNDPEIG
jgi:hypothetical protein